MYSFVRSLDIGQIKQIGAAYLEVGYVIMTHTIPIQQKNVKNISITEDRRMTAETFAIKVHTNFLDFFQLIK